LNKAGSIGGSGSKIKKRKIHRQNRTALDHHRKTRSSGKRENRIGKQKNQRQRRAMEPTAVISGTPGNFPASYKGHRHILFHGKAQTHLPEFRILLGTVIEIPACFPGFSRKIRMIGRLAVHFRRSQRWPF
jgi:hypothetical protein